MEKILVTVIIPTYNARKYICEAIDSVLHQSFKKIEIIVIDDGSDDKTEDAIADYKSLDNFSYFYQKNSGPAAARNNGINRSQGKLISFLDADDVWLPDFLEEMVAAIISDETVGIVYCHNYYVDETLSVIENYTRGVKVVNGNGLLDLFCSHFILTPGVVVKKECIDRLGGFDEKYIVGEDYKFFMKILSKYPIRCVEKKLWLRRVLGESLSRLDFLLDARNDINMLTEFAFSNKEFYYNNKRLIKKRISEYYYDVGYRCVDEGKAKEAYRCYLMSLMYGVTLKSIKGIVKNTIHLVGSSLF